MFVPAERIELVGKQRCVIDVDPTGTAASAYTVLGGIRGAPERYVLDRPFLFFLRHRASGAVLFAGQLLDPTTARGES